MNWVKIRSWHIIRREAGDFFEFGRTLCGRTFLAGAPRAAEFPEDERTCETCLRKVVR